MNLRIGSSARKTSPERLGTPVMGGGSTASTAADASSLQSRAPKRTGSFGKGLGLALANGMTKASEAMPAMGRKTPATTPRSVYPGSKEFPFGSSSTTTSTTQQAAPGAMGPPPGPDPSHLSTFSLRLSELVNQALLPTVMQAPGNTAAAKHTPGRAHIPSIDQIVYDGRHLPSRIRIQELAQTVVAELEYGKSVDAYLLRAVSRAALKALTLLASRLDSLVIPVAKDPSSLIMPTTAKEGVYIAPALEYNIGLATLIWIVEDALENCIEGDEVHAGMPPFVHEILNPVRKRMEMMILHVIQPVLTAVKTSLTASVLKGLRHPFVVAGGSPALTPSVSNNDLNLGPVSPAATPPPSAFASPNGAGMAVAQGNWLKELQGRLEGSRKLLVPRIEARTSKDGEGWFISVAVHLIWKGLFILTARPIESICAAAAGNRSTSIAGYTSIGDVSRLHLPPGQLTAALKSVASVGSNRGRRPDSGLAPTTSSSSASGRGTPSAAAATAGGTDLGRTDGTSTPSGQKAALPPFLKASAAQVADVQAFQKLALKFCKGFVTDKALAAVAAELSRADADEDNKDVVDDDAQLQEEDEEDELARQALAEALEASKSVITVIQAMDGNLDGVRAALSRGLVGSPRNSTVDGGVGAASTARPLEPVQLRALKAIPPLLLLHIVYCRLPAVLTVAGSSGGGDRTYLSAPPALFGMTWQEYEKAIAGFVGGGSWASAAAQRWQREVQAIWEQCKARREELSLNKGGDEESEQLELGTTPTAARNILDASEATPRAADSHLLLSARPQQQSISRVSSRSSSSAYSSSDGGRPSQEYASRREPLLTSSSPTVLSPEQSPSLSPAIPGHDDIEPMEGSIASLNLAGSQQDMGTASGGQQRSSSSSGKSRFWKSSNSINNAGDASSVPSSPRPEGAPGSGSATPSSTSRGFHLPLLSRSSFVGRSASPSSGPTLRGLGVAVTGSRSRSAAAKRAPLADAGLAAGREESAEEAELMELDRTEDALRFFAAALEWAAWSAGVEVKCRLR